MGECRGFTATMKSLLVLLLISATMAHDSSESGSSESSSGESGEGMKLMPKEKGLCLEPDMMGAVCTADTEIGMKFMEAIKKCTSNQEETVANRKRRGKRGKKAKKAKKSKGGKKGSKEGDKCDVDFEQVIGFFEEFWANQSCILKEVGWVNDGDEISMDMIADDLASLPEFITVGMNDTRSMCSARAENATVDNIFGGDQFHPSPEIENRSGSGSSSSSSSSSSEEECSPEFDESELSQLEEVLQRLAFFRCIHENFMEACGNYILGQIYGLMQPQPEVRILTNPGKSRSGSRRLH